MLTNICHLSKNYCFLVQRNGKSNQPLFWAFKTLKRCQIHRNWIRIGCNRGLSDRAFLENQIMNESRTATQYSDIRSSVDTALVLSWLFIMTKSSALFGLIQPILELLEYFYNIRYMLQRLKISIPIKLDTMSMCWNGPRILFSEKEWLEVMDIFALVCKVGLTGQ